jgi:predicted MFS family arabinose efflux permease
MSTEAGSEKITKQNALAFTAAWLGWAFDGLDGFLYTLVAQPLVASLLKTDVTNPEVMAKAALVQAVFLIGWALGGAFFGRVGDAIGRTKTLNITILTYAVFTGLTFFATEWWHLLIFRFIAALGIGGEWAAGAALVGETVPSKYRHWASALLQSGYMFGMILASYTVRYLAGFEHKYVFLIGVLPALITLWIRKAVPEPEEWLHNKKTQTMPKITDLFGKEVLPTTLKVLAMSTICLLGAWTILYFGPALIRKHPDNAGLSPKDLNLAVAGATITFTCWNIAGNFFTAWLTKAIGYRKGMIAILAVALVVFLVGFSTTRSASGFLTWICASAFFGLGVFGAFPLYFPMLFPTLLRTTGAGFCYNAGRLITAGGTLYAGSLLPQQTFYYAGFLFIPAVLIALTMPELKNREEKAIV